MSESAQPLFDELRITQVLDRHGVEYVLVGGSGARLHGATRITRDFDVCPAWDMENLGRLAEALREMGATMRDMPLDVHLPPPTAAGLYRMNISNWETDAGYLDILIGIPSGVPQHDNQYDALLPRATPRDVAGCMVYVAALEDIIVSKEIADRAKDREALPELRALQAAAYPQGIDAGLATAAPQPTPDPGEHSPSLGPGYRQEPPGRSLA